MNGLDKQYQSLLSDIIENGVTKKTRNGETISVFGRQIRHKMSEGFPLLTTKKMYWKGIVTELLWFLRGETHLKFLLENDCHIWDGDAYARYERAQNYDADKTVSKEEFVSRLKTDPQFAKTWGELGPIYGKQWRDWGGYYEGYVSDEKDEKGFKKIKMLHKKGIDQIQTLINELRTNPDSRRLIVSAWNISELDRMTLPPCHYGFQIYTRELSAKERTALGSKGSTKLYDSLKEGKYETIDADEEMHKVCDAAFIPKRAISLMWNQRSVDTFLGLPFNIASYGLLLEIIAKEVGMIPDELIGNLGDTHLYSEHITPAKEQLLRTPYNLPKLNFNSEWWDEDKSFFESVKSDYFCKCLLEEDIQLSNYESHPAIKAPLSN